MKIGMIQNHVTDDFYKNFEEIKKYIQSCVDQQADIIVLPEMWNIPYHNDIILDSIQYHDECIEYFKSISKRHSIYIIAGTIACPKNDKVYNTCHIFYNGEEICTYDKMHLFEVHSSKSDYMEKDVFSPGHELKTFNTPWGTCGILVCYDVRFPEVSRLLAENNAKIIFCPAAFNETVGLLHWQPLLQTRAMENEVFVVGVNPNAYTYKSYTSHAHSMIISPFGEVLKDMGKDEVCVYDIDMGLVDYTRKKMPFWKIRRTDVYELKEKKHENN